MVTHKNIQTPAPPVGWPLLPVPENGSMRYPTMEESVRQSIRIILLTRPGEQLRRPEFGAGLQHFLHESNTLTTRHRIQGKILEALSLWEPRIIVDRVEVWEVEDRRDAVRVEIVYRLKRTGTAVSMMLTMKLGN